MVVSDFYRRASKPPPWTRFLYQLVRRLDAATVVELGSAVGISATALGLGLPDHGRLVTIEGRLAGIARETIADADLSARVEVVDGLFDEVYEDVLTDHAPVDLVFIDGNHYEQPTLRYFEQALRFVAPSAVFVFDDIHWSDEMESAWERLRRHPRSVFSVDLKSLGLVAV